MDASFDIVLLLIMLGYGFLSGAGIYCFKLGIEKITDYEVSIKNLFRNPFLTIYKFIKVPLVLLGAVSAISGFLVYQYTLLTYDVSVVKPLTNLNLVFIFLFGFIILKEHVTKRELIGLVAMISGVILTSFYAEETGTAPSIINMIIFSVIALTIFVIFFVITSTKENRKIAEYLLAISSGIFFGLGVLFNKAIYETGFDYNWQSYVYNPFTYLLVLSYALGLFIEVVAFRGGRLVVVGSIVNLISVGVPVLGAFFIFNEALLILFAGQLIFPLSFLKLIGIILIFIGTIAIYPRTQKIQIKEAESTV